MALKQCEKCSEMVDEAKAFCPGCGNAFVEEERPETTDFQKLEHTVEFGQTMYSQMLEDMGLKISDAPISVEQKVSIIAPIKTESTVPKVVANESAPANPTEKIPDKPKSTRNLKLYVLGGLAVFILFVIAVVSAMLFIQDILPRFSR